MIEMNAISVVVMIVQTMVLTKELVIIKKNTVSFIVVIKD